MASSLERGSLLHKRYRIIDILGQGGMGSVYRAIDENLGVAVAVKENLFTTDEYARQFRLEAVILANLRHANLPRVTDHFVIGEQGQYLIMDYIEGEDLRQRMERQGTVSEEDAILIGAAMCEALQYLHTRKPSIIHRDVKPGNVRISPDGHIFLVDFGLAKLVKGSQATTTGARAMTPGYSPPEQYGTARTDPRTDIYSLGATLYAAVTGIIPEDGLARAMDNVDLTPVRKRNPRISRKLAAAIEKAMAVRPENRFQSAEEFRLALMTSNIKTQKVEGAPVVDPTPTPAGEAASQLEREIAQADKLNPPIPSRPRKKRNSGRRTFLLFFLLTILLGALFVALFGRPLSSSLLGLFALPTEPTRPTDTLQPSQTVPLAGLPSETPSRTHTITQTASLTLTASITPTPTETPLPTATPLGGGFGQIAFASDRAGAPQIFLINADGSEARQITNLPDGACQPDWSPDGHRLVFISPCLRRQDQYPGAKLYIVNADGSDLTALPASDEGDFDPAWSPDGSRIAFTSLLDGSLQIYVLDLSDNSVVKLTEPSTDTRYPDWSRQPAWSPTGTQILYTGHSRLTGALQIWVMSDAGRGQAIFVRRGSVMWNFLPAWSPDGTDILFGETSGAQALGWLMTIEAENHLTVEATRLRSGILGNHGTYSPDGLWVVYENLDIYDSSRVDYDLYRMNISTAPVRLTDNPAQDFDPDWRPIAIP
jgi:serine/threonine protein kinase